MFDPLKITEGSIYAYSYILRTKRVSPLNGLSALFAGFNCYAVYINKQKRVEFEFFSAGQYRFFNLTTLILFFYFFFCSASKEVNQVKITFRLCLAVRTCYRSAPVGDVGWLAPLLSHYRCAAVGGRVEWVTLIWTCWLARHGERTSQPGQSLAPSRVSCRGRRRWCISRLEAVTNRT